MYREGPYFTSMCNDLDEAPDPAAPLTAAAKSAEFVAQTGSESSGTALHYAVSFSSTLSRLSQNPLKF